MKMKTAKAELERRALQKAQEFCWYVISDPDEFFKEDKQMKVSYLRMMDAFRSLNALCDVELELESG